MMKPNATSVFTALLIATLMRMLWFWLIGRKIIDAIGLTAMSLALIALLYLALFHPRRKE